MPTTAPELFANRLGRLDELLDRLRAASRACCGVYLPDATQDDATRIGHAIELIEEACLRLGLENN